MFYPGFTEKFNLIQMLQFLVAPAHWKHIYPIQKDKLLPFRSSPPAGSCAGETVTVIAVPAARWRYTAENPKFCAWKHEELNNLSFERNFKKFNASYGGKMCREK